jgi:type IV secretory pathway TrbD component
MAELEQTPAPPVGEQIHMPAPSLLPVINAFGLALAIVAITISWYAVGIGLVIFLISTVIWIVKARREMDELPAVHHHH